MSSPIYFEFLNAVWEQLPEADRGRVAELWNGYEQVLAAAYQKYVEVNLNIAVSDLQPWSTERWLNYTFGESNYIPRPAVYISNQDLSAGMNLTSKYLLKFRINGGTPFEVDVRGYDQTVTQIGEIVRKINGGAGFEFATTLYDDTILKLSSNIIGENSSIEFLPTSIPSKNACEFVLGIDPNDLPSVYPKYRYPYTVPYSRVASIPEFRDKIRDESVTEILTEGVDYVVEEGGIVTFKAIPPTNLWAERTQIDNENPWYNYGFLTEIFQKNSPRYVGVIQGLWFALWNGPTPANIRVAMYLLFGLPVTKAAGIVTSVSSDSITILEQTGTTSVYPIPTGLESEVALGDSVKMFQPLVSGIYVFDKVNTPGFIEDQIGRIGIQRFLTENATRGEGDTDETKALKMLEEYTFLPQISVDAFVYPDVNLKNVTLFLDLLKPICKTYLFQVIVGSFKDIIGLTDRMAASIFLSTESTLDANETADQVEGYATDDSLNSRATPVLDAYEIALDPHSDEFDALGLDPHSILFDDSIEVEVRSFGVLIDSFTA